VDVDVWGCSMEPKWVRRLSQSWANGLRLLKQQNLPHSTFLRTAGAATACSVIRWHTFPAFSTQAQLVCTSKPWFGLLVSCYVAV
jgi:hypothetical protein